MYSSSNNQSNNHVRRSHPGSSFEHQHRFSTNPQPIPPNSTPSRNYGPASQAAGGFTGPGYSPVQSPHQSGQFMTPPGAYSSAGNTSEANAPQAAVYSSGKSHSNGQYVYHSRSPFVQQQSQMRMHGYASANQTKYTGQASNAAQFMTPTTMYYMPTQGRAQFASIPPNTHGVIQQNHRPPMQVHNSPAYIQQPHYYSQSPYPFAQYDNSMTYQSAPSTQSPMHVVPTSNMPPPQPVQAPTTRRKGTGITIRDPSTMKDVTEDILHSGKKSGSSSPSASSTTAPVSLPNNESKHAEETAAQFALQVASAAAKPSAEGAPVASAVATHTVSSDEVDTSIPSQPAEAHGPIPSNTETTSSSEVVDQSVQLLSTPTVNGEGDTSAEMQSVMETDIQSIPTAEVDKIPSEAEVAVIQPLSNDKTDGLISLDKDDQVLEQMHGIEETFNANKVEELLEPKPVSVETPVEEETDFKTTESENKKANEAVSHPCTEASDNGDSATELNTNNAEIDFSTSLIVATSKPDEITSGDNHDNGNSLASEPIENLKNTCIESQPDGEPDQSSKFVETAVSTSSVDASLPISLPSTSDEKTIVEDQTTNLSSDAQWSPESSKIATKVLGTQPVVDVEVKSSGDKNSGPEVDVKMPKEGEVVVAMKETPPAETPPTVPEVIQQAPSKTEENKTVKVDEALLLDEGDDDRKMSYNRDFLMKFRYNAPSMEKPKDLPPISDIIMDKPHPKQSASNALPSNDGKYRNNDFTPSYIRSGGSSGHGGRSNSRGVRGGGPQRQGSYSGHSHSGSQGGGGKPLKKVSIKREPEPDLKKSENAWKPSAIEKKSEKKATNGETDEEEQNAVVQKQVRSILNKLTPQKFSKLMQKFQLLAINTEGRLRDVIDLIFEKAIDEPNFCEAYANMCRTMSQFRITTPVTSVQQAQSTTVEFRKILLTRCQREFEKDRANEVTLAKLRQKQQDATTPEDKQSCKEELELAETKERRRMLGNIRFIGELFKLRMLTESIMHNCIMSLFKGRDDESLESLCRLLTTIGKDLDHVKGKQRMDQYFQQMDKIIRERKTSPRVRFMLQDVIDLRKAGWVQRAVKAQGPKTIDQIHADAKEEKEKIALQAAVAASNTQGKSQSRGSRLGSRGGGGQSGSDDGWTKVPQKATSYDPNKMKLSKISQNFDENTVMLGPTRGKHGWKSGSGSAATKIGSGNYSRDRPGEMDGNSSARSSTPTMMNRFSALGSSGGQESHMSKASGRSSSREGGSRSGSRGSGGFRDTSRSEPNRIERQAALEAARQLTSQDPKPPRKASNPTAKGSTDSQPDVKLIVDEDVIEKKYKSIMTEYFHIVNFKEAHECFTMVKVAPESTYLFVKFALEMSLEKSSSDRINAAELLCAFVKNSTIHPDRYIKGVVSSLELAVDVELDLPKVWSCVAEQISPIFYSSANLVHLRVLKKMAEPLIEEDKAAIFVAEILKRLIKQLDVNTVVQYWNESELCWGDLLRTANQSIIEEFLQRHNLGSFSRTSKQQEMLQQKSELSRDYETHLASVSKQIEMKKSDKEIIDWLTNTLSSKQHSEPSFVRAITTAVCEKAIVQSDLGMEVDKNFLKERTTLLNKFIDDEEKELQAVYALQRLYLILEQPPNVLKLLFDALYDEDVITEQTFFKWEKDTDPAESDGKGVALLSVNPFFTWLRQADEVESDE